MRIIASFNLEIEIHAKTTYCYTERKIFNAIEIFSAPETFS